MRNPITSLILTLLALVLGTGSADAVQGTVQVEARLSTGVAKLGAPVDLVVTVDGASEAELGSLPAVTGLTLGPVPGPRTSQTMIARNGRMTVQRQVTWRIPVTAAAAGDYRIPGFEVVVAGRRHATQALDLRVREDLLGAELGHFEIQVTPEKLVVGQPFDLTLTFGWDASLASKVNHADLSLPWWDRLLGVIEIEGTERDLGARLVQINLNGRTRLSVESLGMQEIRGRSFDLFRLRKSFLATHAGAIELPTSHLEFGRVSQGGFFENPRPLEMYYVAADPDPIEVGTLPESGRPLEFTGAVGSIEARAVADRRDVDLGDSIKVKVEWSGDGNLEFFDLPELGRLDAFGGFRSYGATEELRQRFGRVAVFDLAPLDPKLTEVPPIPLWVFDPSVGEYALVETDPIPIRVRALEGTGGLEDVDEPDGARDIRGLGSARFAGRPAAGGTGPGGSGLPVLGGVAGVFLAWGFLRRPLRGGVDPASARERRRRKARKVLRRALARGAGEAEARHAAVHDYLAARTGEGPAAWVGRDVVAWGAETGGRDLDKLGLLLERLEAARFAPGGGADAPTDSDVWAALADAKGGGL